MNTTISTNARLEIGWAEKTVANPQIPMRN